MKSGSCRSHVLCLLAGAGNCAVDTGKGDEASGFVGVIIFDSKGWRGGLEELQHGLKECRGGRTGWHVPPVGR